MNAIQFRLKPWHITLLKTLIHLSCLSYIAGNYYLATIDALGADPVKALIHNMGIASLNLLLLSLTISPVARYLKLGSLLQTRRLIGLYCFVFALFHIANYLAFELQLDWQNFLDDIIERPYITVGMATFAILLALTITSPLAMRQKLKKHWQQLHNLVYPGLFLAWLHMFWSIKSDLTEPGIYLLLVVILFIVRKDQAKYWIKKQIKRLT